MNQTKNQYVCKIPLGTGFVSTNVSSCSVSVEQLKEFLLCCLLILSPPTLNSLTFVRIATSKMRLKLIGNDVFLATCKQTTQQMSTV